MSFTDEYFKALEEEKKKKKEQQKHRLAVTNGITDRNLLNHIPDGDIAPSLDNLYDGSALSPNDGTMLMPRATSTSKKKEDERTWFSKGLLEDGYDFGDVSMTLLGTIKDVRENLYAGVIGATEGVIDTGAGLVGAVGGLFSEDFQKKTDKFIQKDLLDEEKLAKVFDDMSGPLVTNLILKGNETDKVSFLGEKFDALTQSGGQLLLSAGLQAVGVPWQVTMGVTSYGSELENALRNGATSGEAHFSAAVSAGAEILTGSLFKIPGISATGSGKVGQGIVGKLTKNISNTAVKNLINYGVNIFGEGFEEVGTSFFQRLGQALSYEREDTWEKLAKDENARSQYVDQVIVKLFGDEAREEYGEAFIGGAVLAGVGGIPGTVQATKAGRDINTGLSADEQAVLDKVAEEEIQRREESGEKLTARQKIAIEEELRRNLEKGRISVEKIEEILGGDSYNAFKTAKDHFFESSDYKAYQKAVEAEEKARAEFEPLVKMKQGEMTGEQIYRRDELKKILDESKVGEMKTKLSGRANNVIGMRNAMRSEVMSRVKDGYLAESYREQARKQEKFSVDVNQYTDENAKRTVQNIIDSGLGDNSNQFRETVDFLAKLSADKGVTFSLTNNEQIRGTKHYKAGYVTNGFVTDDGDVTLNMDSPRALNTTVGHEITHVLEKTGAYKELQEAVFNYAIAKEGQDKFNARLKEAEEAYRGKKNTSPEAEITADIIGEYLFTDYDFVQGLSTSNRNLFQKIYDEIKYMVKIATAGSREARELEKAKKMFDKAYRENVKGVAEKTSDAAESEVTIDPENDSDLDYESPEKYSVTVEDPELINFLENQEHITTYKAMVLIDGKLYPPMASKVKGEDGKYHMTNPRELGEWMMAEEDTTNIKFNDKGVGYYDLKKDDGGTVKAAYNPYEHSSNLVLNDQFEAAYKRENLVTVECVIPVSEMTSGYKAEYAKDSVGMMDWHSGVVAGKLSDNKRSVYLSRYLKTVRILSDAEVAQKYKDIVGDLAVPFNVVSPGLLTELEKLGVNIDYDGSPQYQYLQRRAAEREAEKAKIDALGKEIMDSKSIQYSYSAIPSHRKSLEKNFDFNNASMDLETINQRYDKIIDIWERLGGELDSKFLNDWNNKVERPFTIFKAQAGYKYNVELSSMCKKGVPLFEAIDTIVKKEIMKELDTDVLGKEEKEILYDLLKKHNFEIPCAICYVEQARQREGVIIDAFLNGKTEVNGKGETTSVKLGWNNVLDAIQKEMRANGVDYTFAFVSRDIATDKYTPADNSMDEKTYAAFAEAVKKVANEEIARYNKENGKRRKLLKDVTPEAVKECFKGTLPANLKIFQVLLTEPSSRFKIQSDLLYSSMTTQNLTMAHNKLYSLFNSQGGVSGYKTKQAPTVYWGEILGKKWKPEDTRKEGGVRNQSNSDFQMYTLLDQAQMYMDFSAKGYYLQAYTKVLSELKLFGLSKSKINASLIPKVKVYRNADGSVDVEKTMANAGLDENGNPFYDDIEGINHKEAFMLLEDPEYSKNIGGICIGYSDNHIRKLLDDSRVQLIIGYHDKTNDPDKRYRGARYAKNYNGLNEAVNNKDGKTVHIGFNTFVKKAENKFKYNSETESFEGTVEYNGKTYTADDIPRLAADLYLEQCAKKDYTPAYDAFKDHRNYYKLLADFSLYDSQGHYAPHQKVAYNMPDTVPYLDADGNKQYMATEEYIKNELQKELAVRDALVEALSDTSEDGIIPQFKAEVNRRKGVDPDKYSFTKDTDGNQLTVAQDEFFKDSQMRDEDGNLKVMYHGSENAGFHVFKSQFSDDGQSFFFVDSVDVAESYSGTSHTYTARVFQTADELNEFLKEVDAEDYEVREENGKFNLYDDGDLCAESETAQGLFERFRDWPMMSHEHSNYKVYLNIKNPFKVDAEGRSWDELPGLGERKYEYIKVLDTTGAKPKIEYSMVGDPAPTVEEVNFDDKFDGNLAHMLSNMAPGEELYGADANPATTRDYAKYARENGYDGVIFENIHDLGQYMTGDVATVAIVFDSNQIKSTANTNPTPDEDIRYSMSKDSAGNQLTEAQDEFFRDSVIRDENGSLMPMYHGTKRGGFTVFDGGKDYWYFTKDEKYANTFEGRKDNGEYYPSVQEGVDDGYFTPQKYSVYLNVKNPFITDDIDVIEDALYWDKTLPEQLRKQGYDALMLEDMSQVIVLNQNQIKNMDNLNPTEDSDIRYSMTKLESEYQSNIDSGNMLGAEKIVEQMAELAMPDSKIRGEDGKLLPVYHGTNAMFWEFDTSADGGKNGTAEGFGIYLSDNQEVTNAYGDRQIKMFANITKPATSFEKTITRGTLVKLIKDTCMKQAQQMVAEEGYDSLHDAIRDTWISNYVDTYSTSMEMAYREVANSMLEQNDNDKDIIHEVMFGMAIRSYDQAMEFYHNSLTPVTGIDGFITTWDNANTGKTSNIYLAFDSSQLKSADAVTYDDNGNIIPLSDRFNPEKGDIRYSISKEGAEPSKHGNWHIYGSDFGANDPLEDFAPVGDNVETTVPGMESVAPMGTSPKATTDDGDWREAFNALTDEDAPPLVDNTPPKKITTIKERVDQKISNAQAELDKNRQHRQEAYQNYANQIAKAEAELAGKKNQHTKAAEDLKRRIERLKRQQGDIDATYEKRISDLEKRVEKYASEDYSRAEYRREVQEMMTQFWADTIGDTSTWKDLPLGLAYKTKTLRRILRAVVRDPMGNRDIDLADTIYDELETKYDHNEAQLKVESGKLKKVFAEMKLTSAEDTYAQMLGEFRHNPETTLTQEVVDEYYQKHKDKIDPRKVDRAIEESRKLYDDLIVRVNKVLRQQGMREIHYRQGYFPHFTNPKQNWLMKLLNWKPVDNEIPTSIAGLTQDFKPQRSWQTFAQKRRGDTTDYSLYKGLDTYVHGALDWIYHIEDIQSRRSLENYIRYIHSDEGIQQRIQDIYADDTLDALEVQDRIDAVLAEAKNPLSGLVRELMNRTNTLANKKSSMDREMEDMVNRKVYSTMTNLNNRVTANMVVGSFSSALTNFIPMVQSWHQVSPVYTVKGLADMVRSTIHDDGTIAKSDFLTNRLVQEENLYKTGWDKVSDKAAVMMNVVDNITSQTVWRSKYLQNIHEGMSEQQAIKDADQFAKNLIAGRSRGNMPSIFDAKNPLTKIFTAFQLEVANQYGYMFEDAPQDSTSKTRLVKGYATAFMGAYLYNALYSSLVGRDAAFDPIGIIEDLLGDLFDDEEEPEDIILNFTENVIQEVPFVGGLMGGGRIPISSALPYSSDSNPFESMLKDVTNGNWDSFGKELLKPLYYLLMPVGGGQIKKTVEGLGMFLGDHPISGSYTDGGELRFPVEKTFGNVLQAGLFGQYASKNAREYFDNGYAPLDEKRIQEYIDVDLPIGDYWEYLEGLKGLKTMEEKADYINSLDLPAWKKNLLINNISNRKEAIDMTSYGDYADFEEFDFAQNYPEKYTVAKVIADDFSTYTKYVEDMSKLDSKDEYGDTVSGLKKERVLKYINSLDIDYGQKIILFRSMYDSKADKAAYNADIVEYLNSRDDISYDEMVSILTALGFTVYSDGTVKW